MTPQNLSSSNRPPFNYRWAIKATVLALIVLGFAGAVVALCGDFVSQNSRAATGSFSFAMLGDSLVRLNAAWTVLVFILGLSSFCAVLAHRHEFLMMTLPLFVMCVLLFLINHQTQQEDLRIKAFATLHANALNANAALQIDGFDVVDLPDKQVWSASLLQKFKAIDAKSKITSVVGLCKPQCTKVEVWRGNTVRIVDLVDPKVLYSR